MDQQIASSHRREVLNPRGVLLKRPGPAGGVRDTNRQQRSQAIREAALTLFLERGIEGVSVDDIMRAAEMAKGSFYRYFADQEGLVADLVNPVEVHVLGALEACVGDLRAAGQDAAARTRAYDALIAAFGRVVAEHKGRLRLYLQENRAPGVGPRRPIHTLMKQISTLAVDLAAADPQGPFPGSIALAMVGSAERLLLGLTLGETSVADTSSASGVFRRVLEVVRAA